MRSALFAGRVTHQRLRAPRPRLAYRMFSLLVDIDELGALDTRLRWFSVGRFNLFGLYPADYCDGTAADAPGLRALVESDLRDAGLAAGGAIRLLTMPRILGYAFNPLSVWFCESPGSGLQAIIYEVNNTFGERHSYLIEVDPRQRPGGVVLQRCDKRLHVSPFLGMDLHYRFCVEPPAEKVSVGISVHDALGGAVLATRLQARRRPLTDAALLRVLVTYPLLTLKVIVGIHWEALRLWLKGVRLHKRPAAPERPLSVSRSHDVT